MRAMRTWLSYQFVRGNIAHAFTEVETIYMYQLKRCVDETSFVVAYVNVC